MSVQTVSEYWLAVKQSRVFDEATLETFRHEFGNVDNVAQLARQLIDCGGLTDWQARYLLSGKHHLRVGQYVLLERLPIRAVGDRFLAIHKTLDRKVEVNWFPASLADDNELFAGFLERASRVARLDHPNLVHLYDIDQESGRFYFVFEHDEGTPLDRLPAGELSARQIAGLSRQLLDGLDYAHGQGLIHGQLNETQVRVDSTNRVRISNMGLASMMDQLSLEGSLADEFAIQPVAADDAVAVGKMILNLFAEQVGQPGNKRERLLATLLGDLSRLVDGTADSAAQYRHRIDQWIELDDAAQAASQNIGAAAAGPLAARESSLVRPPRVPAKPGPIDGSFGPAAGGQWRIAIIAGVAVAVIGVALAIYFWRGDRAGLNADLAGTSALDKAAQNTGRRLPGPGKSQPQPALPEHPGNSADDHSGGSDTEPAHSPNGTSQRQDPGRSNAPPPGPADPGKTETLVAQLPSGGDRPPDPGDVATEPRRDGADAGRPAAEEVITPAPSGPPDTPARDGETVDGVPVIAWQDAGQHLDQTVAVRGTVVAVGKTSNGSIWFLNFDKQNRDSFTGVVRNKYLDEFSPSLESLFLGQQVFVIGKMTVYRERTPQIEVTSRDQIRLASEIRTSTHEGVTDGPVTGDGVTGDAVTAGEPETAAPFRALPRALDLPPYDRETAVADRVLGQMFSGDSLLGMELVTLPGFAPRGGVFTIERDPNNVNRWEIRFAQRAADDPVTVAEFRKTGHDLSFAWQPAPGLSDNVNYLKNCLLRIRSPDDSVTCMLRTPVEVEPLMLASRRPTADESLLIDNLPDDAFVAVEFQKFAGNEFPDQNSELGYTLTPDLPATEVFFNRDALQRVIALRFEFRMGTRLRVDADLMVNSPNGFMPYREATYRGLGDELIALQANLASQKLAADQFDPPYGQKTKHKNYVKDLSKQLDLVNLQVESYRAAGERLTRIFGRPIHFRVLYRANDVEVELARTTGWGDTANDSSSSEPAAETGDDG